MGGFSIILCGKEVCIGFCRFKVWLCFFGARIGGLFSYPFVKAEVTFILAFLSLALFGFVWLCFFPIDQVSIWS